MSRKRDLKPSFFLNEDLGAIDPLARLAFQGLWCEADCEGRLEDRPARLKIKILPYDNCDFNEILEVIHRTRMIIRYADSAERRLIQVVNFEKHQNPHPAEKPKGLEAPDLEESNLNKLQAGCKQVASSDKKPASNALTSSPSFPSSTSFPFVGEDSSAPEADAEPPVISIPLVNGTDHGVTQEAFMEYQTCYPGIDVLSELRKCRSWNIDNPTNRKTPKGIRRHVNAWLSRAQDKSRPEATNSRDVTVANRAAAEAVMNRELPKRLGEGP